MKELKDLIREANEQMTTEQKLTYCELAKAIGVTRQTIWNILQDRATPTLDTIKKICKYFGVDYHDYV